MHSWHNWQSWHSSFQNCHGLGTEPAGWRLGHRTDPFRSWNTQSIRRHSETFGDVVHSHRCWKAKSGRRIFRIFLTHGQFTGLKICRPSWARTSPSAEGNCSSPTAAIWIRAVPECQTAHKFGINEQSHSWYFLIFIWVISLRWGSDFDGRKHVDGWLSPPTAAPAPNTTTSWSASSISSIRFKKCIKCRNDIQMLLCRCSFLNSISWFGPSQISDKSTQKLPAGELLLVG